MHEKSHICTNTRRMGTKTTLVRISENTGYSISTISRVLNGKTDNCRISEKAASLIRAEAERLEYPPRPLAQILRKGKSKTLGVVLPSVTNPFFAEMSGSIISEIRNRGYSAIVVVTMEREDEQEACISTLLSKKVDGILAAPCGNDALLFERLNNTVPVVLVDRFFVSRDIPFVTSNNFNGAYDATMLLINSGHRNIACIQGHSKSLPNRKRVDGYMAAMENSGLSASATVTGDEFSIQCGYLETKLLMSRKDRPTAIFALSYTIVLGVMKALRDCSLRIGEDISVISFDDNISLDFMLPAITRVRQPVEEMGKLATRILIGRIEGTTGKTPQLELNTELMIRGSIRNINAGQ